MALQEEVNNSKSHDEEQLIEHSQNPSSKIHDNAQGAENVQSKHQVLNITSAVQTGEKNGAVYRYFGPFPARPEKVFHIQHNGHVQMGLLQNMEDFEGEVGNKFKNLNHDYYT